MNVVCGVFAAVLLHTDKQKSSSITSRVTTKLLILHDCTIQLALTRWKQASKLGAEADNMIEQERSEQVLV